ncbi:MAG: XdhC family protein [Chitinophagales bacterium]
MSELEAIITAYDALKSQGVPAVLATVVHVEGSAFRQSGARMLISAEGRMTGAISGGCLEGDALKKALLALHQGENKLVTYDTSDEEDAVIGAQLGCNGVIQVLFEPIEYNSSTNPVELLKMAVRSSESVVLVVRFRLSKKGNQAGTQFLVAKEHQFLCGKPEQRLVEAILAGVGKALAVQRDYFETCFWENQEEQVFYNLLIPPPMLVLIGAGNDAQRIAEMAGLLGWRVTVMDGRPTHANAQRFAGGCQIIVGKPERVVERLPRGPRTAVVLMTHNYPYDLAVLRSLLPQLDCLPYLGIMGPKKRFERMVKELEEEGVKLSAAQLNRIYAPCGLALGAEQAAEIGLSILSEVMACFNSANAGFLREKQGPIHDRGSAIFQISRVS